MPAAANHIAAVGTAAYDAAFHVLRGRRRSMSMSNAKQESVYTRRLQRTGPYSPPSRE